MSGTTTVELGGGFLHACPDDPCICFPSIEFQCRPEIQEMIKTDRLQEVFDLWERER